MKKATVFILMLIMCMGMFGTAAAEETDPLQKFFVYSISADDDTRIQLADFLKGLPQFAELNDSHISGVMQLLPELTEAEARRALEVYTTRSRDNMDGILDVILFGARKTPYTEYMPEITKRLNRLIIGSEADNRGIDYLYTLIALYNFSTIFGGDGRLFSNYPGLPGLIYFSVSGDVPASVINKISGAIDLMPTLKKRLLDFEGASMLERMLKCAEEIINDCASPEIYHFKLALKELGVARDEFGVTMQNNKVEGLTFRDLDSVGWAVPQIRALTENGAISGKSRYIFAPGDMITREQFVKIITEAFDIAEEDVKLPYTDINEDEWYYPYVKKAYASGIIQGVSETNFGIGSNITREQMAVILCRISDKTGISLKSQKNIRFTDEENISEWARTEVKTLAQAGVVNGMEGGKFAPQNNATRAQAAVMIYNVLARR